MSYPRRHLRDSEEVVAERGLHIVVLVPKLVSVALMFAGLGAGFLLWKNSPSWFGLILGVIFVITLTYLFVNFLHFRSTQIVLTTQRIIYRSGIFRRTSRDIPLVSIVDVTTVQPLRKRMIGLGDVVLRTTSDQDPTTLSDLAKPRELAALLHGAREKAEQDRIREIMEQDAPVDVAKEYQRLVSLHRKGVLTQVEFEAQLNDLGLLHKLGLKRHDVDADE